VWQAPSGDKGAWGGEITAYLLKIKQNS
jgi:hypothetical protein